MGKASDAPTPVKGIDSKWRDANNGEDYGSDLKLPAIRGARIYVDPSRGDHSESNLKSRSTKVAVDNNRSRSNNYISNFNSNSYKDKNSSALAIANSDQNQQTPSAGDSNQDETSTLLTDGRLRLIHAHQENQRRNMSHTGTKKDAYKVRRRLLQDNSQQILDRFKMERLHNLKFRL